MSTTMQDIRGWLKRAQKEDSQYLIVVCDCFDYKNRHIQWSVEAAASHNHVSIIKYLIGRFDIQPSFYPILISRLNSHMDSFLLSFPC